MRMCSKQQVSLRRKGVEIFTCEPKCPVSIPNTSPQITISLALCIWTHNVHDVCSSAWFLDFCQQDMHAVHLNFTSSSIYSVFLWMLVCVWVCVWVCVVHATYWTPKCSFSSQVRWGHLQKVWTFWLVVHFKAVFWELSKLSKRYLSILTILTNRGLVRMVRVRVRG